MPPRRHRPSTLDLRLSTFFPVPLNTQLSNPQPFRPLVTHVTLVTFPVTLPKTQKPLQTLTCHACYACHASNPASGGRENKNVTTCHDLVTTLSRLETQETQCLQRCHDVTTWITQAPPLLPAPTKASCRIDLPRRNQIKTGARRRRANYQPRLVPAVHLRSLTFTYVHINFPDVTSGVLVHLSKSDQN